MCGFCARCECERSGVCKKFKAKPKAHNIVKISPKFKENLKFLKSLKEINNNPTNIRKNKAITFFLILFLKKIKSRRGMITM